MRATIGPGRFGSGGQPAQPAGDGGATATTSIAAAVSGTAIASGLPGSANGAVRGARFQPLSRPPRRRPPRPRPGPRPGRGRRPRRSSSSSTSRPTSPRRGPGHTGNPANRLSRDWRVLVPARKGQQRVEVQMHPLSAVPAHRRKHMCRGAVTRVPAQHPPGHLAYRPGHRVDQRLHRAGGVCGTVRSDAQCLHRLAGQSTDNTVYTRHVHSDQPFKQVVTPAPTDGVLQYPSISSLASHGLRGPAPPRALSGVLAEPGWRRDRTRSPSGAAVRLAERPAPGSRRSRPVAPTAGTSAVVGLWRRPGVCGAGSVAPLRGLLVALRDLAAQRPAPSGRTEGRPVTASLATVFARTPV